MSLKSKIIVTVSRLFIRRGLRTVSMDDISRELGISKKTLYTFFPAKDALVKAVIAAHIEEEQQMCEEITKKSNNAIDEVVDIFLKMCKQIQGMNPATVYEMKRYFPEAWEIFTEYKNGYIYNSVLNNLKKGMRQGIYRKNIKPEILARIYVNTIDEIVSSEIFTHDSSLQNIYEEFIVYHLHGIVSSEGLQYLDSKAITKKLKS